MPSIRESDGILEIREEMNLGKRVFFLLLALFPLLAPYQLILRTGWTSFFNFIFLLALVISLGAIFLSGFFVFTAVAGLSTLLRFDTHQRVFTYTQAAPIVPLTRKRLPFDQINRLEVEEHDWSDGSPTFSLRVHTKDESSFKSGSFWNKQEAHRLADKVEKLLAQSSAGA
jgi:hypothetical protein